jgi:signal recognition particle subunit SEC65
MNFLIHELAAEAEREVKMRERVYPRWVAAGRMKPAEAERKTEMMREIAARLRAQANTEETAGRLL